METIYSNGPVSFPAHLNEICLTSDLKPDTEPVRLVHRLRSHLSIRPAQRLRTYGVQKVLLQ